MYERQKSRIRSGVAAGLLLVAISSLPAGIGNLGRNTTGNGSQVDVTLPGGQTFTHVITAGQMTTAIRDSLVSQINADPNFQAVAIADPHDPNGVSFQVLTTTGQEIDSLEIRENDSNMDNIAVFYPGGRFDARLQKVAVSNTLAGNGNYRLIVEPWDSPVFDQTFSTTGITAATLDTQVRNALIAAGYSVVDDGNFYTISRPGDVLMGIRVDSSDTGVIVHSLRLRGGGAGGPITNANIPTLSQWGMFGLVLLLTAGAIVVLRRKGAAAGGA